MRKRKEEGEKAHMTLTNQDREREGKRERERERETDRQTERERERERELALICRRSKQRAKVSFLAASFFSFSKGGMKHSEIFFVYASFIVLSNFFSSAFANLLPSSILF